MDGKIRMRIAVFSDIHSNLSALQASIAYARHLGAEGFAFLGDLISDGPDPHAVLSVLRELAAQKPCWFVRGNREEYMLAHHENPGDGWVQSSHYGSFLYTYQQLTEEDIAFLRSMQRTCRIEVPGCPRVLMCHSTPTDSRLMIYPGTEAADNLLKGVQETTVLSGHCHLQYRYEAFGKQLINPGAVGSHSNGQARAQFAILRCEDGRWIARMLNVDYDRLAELRRYEGSGLPEMGGVVTKIVQAAVKTGHNKFGECFEMARRLAQAEPGAFIADPSWEAAAKQLGVG